MTVKQLILDLSQYDENLDINFCFGVEDGRSYMSGSEGTLEMTHQDDGELTFFLDFEEVYSE